MTGSLRSTHGKFYAVLNLKDENGRRKQKLIGLNIEDAPGNKRKAQKALRTLIAEYEKKQMVVFTKDVLFCDYINEWLDDKKQSIEMDTYEGYRLSIDKHIYPFFKDLKVSVQELTYRHIQAYYKSKQAPKDKGTKPLSANTIKHHHTVINQTLKRAVKHFLITNNPASLVTLPKIEKYTGGYLTVEQGKVLLDVAKDKPIETIIILAMVYGLRRSEIAGLKWSAVDFENETISIQHTVTDAGAKNRTKNKSSTRVLPLNQEVKTYLLKLRDKQECEKGLLGSSYHDTDYVCRRSNGVPLKINWMSKAVKELLSKCGLPPIRLHDLRHSCASYMLKMGCSLKDVSDWLGHSNISTTMDIYAHLDMETRRDTAKRFATLLELKSA